MKNYFSFVFSAYAFAAVVIGVMIAKISLDYRDLRRNLSRFDVREDRRD